MDFKLLVILEKMTKTGSMSFAKEIIETKEVLKKIGFDSDFAPDTYECFNSPPVFVMGTP
jgi:hypothetical protein